MDAVDPDIPDPNLWEPFGVGNARGTTAYVLRTGRPEIIGPERYAELVEQGEIDLIGVTGKGDWLGAPLTADKQTVGVVVCQTYAFDQRYTEADRDLLAYVGQHIGAALTRVRATEETRQRNVELALVNEIGEALARQLDFQSIIDLVGERVRVDLRSPVDVHRPLRRDVEHRSNSRYAIDAGSRDDRSPIELGPGLTSRIIQTRRPLRIGTDEEANAQGACRSAAPTPSRSSACRS